MNRERFAIGFIIGVALAMLAIVGRIIYENHTTEFDMVCTDASGVTYESGWSDMYWHRDSRGATVFNHDTMHALEPTETCTQMVRRIK